MLRICEPRGELGGIGSRDVVLRRQKVYVSESLLKDMVEEGGGAGVGRAGHRLNGMGVSSEVRRDAHRLLSDYALILSTWTASV